MDKPIEQKYLIKAPLAEVWRALADKKEIEEWSGATAFFYAQPGAQYTLWEGQIGGKIIEVVPQKKLKMTWKPEDWTREDSVVTFTLSWEKDATRVDLLHENVQDFDYAGTTEGWNIYYLGEIKKMLEARGAKSAKPKAESKKQKAGAKKTAKKKSAGKKKK